MKVCLECHEPQVLPGERCSACEGEMSGVAPRKGSDLAGALVEGKYELTKLLGEGGMAWVYQGQQRSLERRVAIKLMKPLPGADERRTRRFLREATTAARLMHPHIVMILDTGVSSGGMHYIVTEYIEGQNLGQVIYTKGPAPLAWAVGILNQTLAGVEHAHEHGVIHRDLKPDNIMIVPGVKREVVKVLDFGIAWSPGNQRLTAQGEAVGTPAYMAPEQIKGLEVGAWTDIYSLGIVLFEVLTGRLPFEGNTVHKLMKKQLVEAPPAVHELVSDLPPAVSDLIFKAMAKDPAERFGTVAEFRAALFSTLPDIRSCMDCCDACHHLHDDPLEYCARDSATGMTHLDGPTAALDSQPPDRAPGVPETVSLRVKESVGGAKVSEGAPALAGHQAELARVLTLLHGESPLVQVVGAVGVGKTTLLDETARALATAPDPPRVLRAGSDPWHTRAPWYPVRRLVCQALELPVEPDEVLLREAVMRPGLVSEDLPGLLALFNLGAAPVRTQARFREVMCSAQRALAASASHGRLIILLDDANMFDGCTMRFLAALSQMVKEGRTVGVVLASRSPLSLDGGSATRVSLPPLELCCVEALLEKEPGDVDANLADTLHQRSGGNPLHLDQAVRLLREGRLDAAPEGSLKALVRRRLELLPDAARQVLRALSLLALEVAEELLAELLPDVGLAAQISELEQRGFVALVDRQVTLAHPFLADVVRESISPEALRALHERIFGVLQDHGADPLVLARHAYEARLGKTSLRLQEQAGDLASRWLDDESAGLVHYQRGLHVARWELAPDVDGDLVFGLSMKLGRALRRSGHHLGAEEAFKGSMDFLEPSPTQLARFHLGLGRLLRASGRAEEAADHLQRACRAGGGDEVTLRAYTELADLLARIPDVPKATETLEQGMRLYCAGDRSEDGGCPVGTWKLVLRLAAIASKQGRGEQSEELARQALELAHDEPSTEGQARCSMALGRLLQRSDSAAARMFVSAATVLYMEMGDRKATAKGLMLRASWGDGDSLLAFKGLDLARQVRWPRGTRGEPGPLTRG